MTLRNSIRLLLLFALPWLCLTSAAAQDAPAESEAQAAIVEAIAAGDLDQAAEQLDAALENDPDNEALQKFRRTLAGRFASQREYAPATKQMQKHFMDELARMEKAPGQQATQLATLAQQLGIFAMRSRDAEAARAAIDQALERSEALAADRPAELLEPIAQLTGVKAFLMAQAGDREQARQLVASEVKRLADIVAEQPDSEPARFAHNNLLILLATRSPLGEADENYSDQLAASLSEALEQFPQSSRLRMQYASSEANQIALMFRDAPDAAAERIDAVFKRLEKFAEEDAAVRSMLGRLESYRSRIEAAKKQLEMIGKPAPPLQIEAWANAPEGAEDSLQGKVLLYDFWAVWCGPCIATFPHLREWRSEFGDQGFEIVGITRYYGYQWDEEAQRAIRAKAEVSPEAEQEAIAKFLQSKDMQHPTIFTPADSTLQKEYGVTGIPHAVLVDRQGNVQMIKVGSGPANAEALHAKIKELLAQ